MAKKEETSKTPEHANPASRGIFPVTPRPPDPDRERLRKDHPGIKRLEALVASIPDLNQRQTASVALGTVLTILLDVEEAREAAALEEAENARKAAQAEADAKEAEKIMKAQDAERAIELAKAEREAVKAEREAMRAAEKAAEVAEAAAKAEEARLNA